MGGLPGILRNFHPDELWIGNNPPGDDYNALLAQAAAQHMRVQSFRAGDATTLASVKVQVLSPMPDYVPGKEPSNDDSLVLRASFGATSVLLEGDAQARDEEAIEKEPAIESTLLKVGHHGSASSSRPAFLARVHPQWAVISCGLRNRYGHPRPEVLQELQSTHVRTYSTDIHGAVCFRLDGHSVAPMASCSGDH
jgi:competence protein ComEC